MAMSLGDVLIRRTHPAFESPDPARALTPAAANLIASQLESSATGRDAALGAYEAELERTFRIAGATEYREIA